MSYAAKKPEQGPQEAAGSICRAYRCPCRASIFESLVGPPSGGLCRYHQANTVEDWPRVSELMHVGLLTDEAVSERLEAAKLKVPYMKAQVLPPMANYAGKRGWAERLRDAEKMGAKILPVQRGAWREALGEDLERSEDEREAQEERLAMAEF